MSVPGLNLQPLAAAIEKQKKSIVLHGAQLQIEELASAIRSGSAKVVAVDGGFPAEAVKMLDAAFARETAPGSKSEFWNLRKLAPSQPDEMPPPPKRPRIESTRSATTAAVAPETLLEQLRGKIEDNKREIDVLTDALENATDEQKPVFNAKLNTLTKLQQSLNAALKGLATPTRPPNDDPDADVDDKVLPPK